MSQDWFWSTRGDDQISGGTLGGFAKGVGFDKARHHPIIIRRGQTRVVIGNALRSRAPLRLPSDGDEPHRNEESPEEPSIDSCTAPNASRDARASGLNRTEPCNDSDSSHPRACVLRL